MFPFSYEKIVFVCVCFHFFILTYIQLNLFIFYLFSIKHYLYILKRKKKEKKKKMKVNKSIIFIYVLMYMASPWPGKCYYHFAHTALSLHTLIVHQSLSSLVYLIHHRHSSHQVNATCPVDSYCSDNTAGTAIACPLGKTSIADQTLISACTPASTYYGSAGAGAASQCTFSTLLLVLLLIHLICHAKK